MQIPYLPLRGRTLPRVMGGNIGSREEICETSSLPIPMVPHLYQCNGHIKRKLRAWRVQKCIALVGAIPYLPVRGRKQPLTIRGNIGSTNPHGTASAPMQWLYQKDATGMESSKIYCPSRYRYRSCQCGAANYPVPWGAI